jgi:hypothetical protein
VQNRTSIFLRQKEGWEKKSFVSLKLLPPVVVVVVVKVLLIDFSIMLCEAVLSELYKLAACIANEVVVSLNGCIKSRSVGRLSVETVQLGLCLCVPLCDWLNSLQNVGSLNDIGRYDDFILTYSDVY